MRRELAKKLLLEGMDEATINRLPALDATELQSLNPSAESMHFPG